MVDQQEIERLIDKLGSHDPAVYTPTLDALVEIGAPAVIPLSQANSRRNLAYVISALKMLGPVAVDGLLVVLDTGDLTARLEAVTALHVIQDKHAIGPLATCLDSPEVELRREAAKAFAWAFYDSCFYDGRAVDALIRYLSDEDVKVCCQAAYALGQIGDRRAVKPLLRMAEDRDSEKRYSAIGALGDIGHERTLPAVRRHLKDKTKSVRKSVKRALANFESRKRRQKAQST
jgi:HEAT repeat protein